MKATVHGVAVEGSPQEIMEYQRMQAEKAQMKPLTPHPFDQAKFFRDMQEAAKKQQWVDTTDHFKPPFIFTCNTYSPIDEAHKMIAWNGGYGYLY